MSTPSPTDAAPRAPFVVVGLGASAGGLGALTAFFSGLPETDGAAFVVVIHLAPDRESEMAQILARSVPIPVVQVRERTRIERGVIYVVPPNRNLTMADDHLDLEPLESERRRRRPIDHFFRTLAHAYGDHSIAVVLSGTGHNGTVGVRAIKEVGGLVLAQDPADAEFDEMTRSAIASGVVDTVAPASDLGALAIGYAHRLCETNLLPAEALPEDDVRAVQRVLRQLRVRTGHDFSHYKRSTVLRRLERRLHIVGAASVTEYAAHLQRTAGEAQALLQDLLISVTSFFRDPAAFEALAEHAVPRLFEGKTHEDDVRVWVAGCATGEEAYSVAILLAEHAATLTDAPRLQVFGTDLSEAAIRTAREGVYPESIEADVSPERLRRFFRADVHGYRVARSIRETVLFAPHSLLNEPPFSRVGLVACRNLLIYFERTLQQRALSLFHYALTPGGTLFLGSSETAESLSGAFRAEDKASRIYRRVEADAPVPVLQQAVRARVPVARADDMDAPADTFAHLHDRLRASAAPPSLLVTDTSDVAHVSERAGAFLAVGSGEPSRNVLRLVRPELRVAVQTALLQAGRSGADATAGPVRIELDGAPVLVGIRARPVRNGTLFQVLFETAPAPDGEDDAPSDPAATSLARELDDARDQLHLTAEAFETSREELQTQNEELQSTNEELRSTAEELETSKEEAQSMAEELMTVNDEMKASVDALSVAKGDLENLIASTEIATLFLDRTLHIKWFTPQIESVFRVRPTDIGRPIGDFAPRFGGADLGDDARAVLATLQAASHEVQTDEGRWFLVHVRPYRTQTDHIAGVVVTFVDVTDRRAGEETLRLSVEKYRTLFDRIDQAFALCEIVRDGDGEATDVRLLDVNPAFCTLTGLDSAGIVGQLAYTQFVGLDRSWLELVERVVRTGQAERVERLSAATGRWVELFAFPEQGDRFAFLFADTTERRAASDALASSAARAAFRATLTDSLRLLSTPDAIEAEAAHHVATFFDAARVRFKSVDAEGRSLVRWEFTREGEPSPPASDTDFFALFPTVAAELHAGRTFVCEDAAADRRLTPAERAAIAAHGTEALLVTPVLRDGEVVDMLAIHHTAARAWPAAEIALAEDIAERTLAEVDKARTEAALAEREARYRTLFEAIDEGFALCEMIVDESGAAVDFRYLDVNPSFERVAGLTGPVVGRTIRELIPDVEPVWIESYARVALGRESLRFENDVAPLSRAFNVYATPVDAPELRRFVAVFTDVTASRETEAEIRQLNATLEERVAERTQQVRALSAQLAVVEQEERQRIAQVLHDDLQQQLYGLSMLLSMVAKHPDEATERATRGMAILDEAIATARSLATDLSPAVLRAERLAEVLEWTAAEARDRHGLAVTVVVEGEPEVADGAMRILLYQSLREILFNVVKHAGAAEAQLIARAAPHGLTDVCVEDDGSGFDPEPAAGDHPGGFGLFSVRERLSFAGGRFTVDSAPGAGTRVTLSVPAGRPAPDSP